MSANDGRNWNVDATQMSGNEIKVGDTIIGLWFGGGIHRVSKITEYTHPTLGPGWHLVEFSTSRLGFGLEPHLKYSVIR